MIIDKELNYFKCNAIIYLFAASNAEFNSRSVLFYMFLIIVSNRLETQYYCEKLLLSHDFTMQCDFYRDKIKNGTNSRRN